MGVSRIGATYRDDSLVDAVDLCPCEVYLDGIDVPVAWCGTGTGRSVFTHVVSLPPRLPGSRWVRCSRGGVAQATWHMITRQLQCGLSHVRGQFPKKLPFNFFDHKTTILGK